MSVGIVVGLDESACSQAALAWAAAQARLTTLPLHAVAVLDWESAVGGYGYTWDVLQGVGGDLQSEIAAYASRLKDIFDAIGPEPGWTLDPVDGPHAGKALVRVSVRPICWLSAPGSTPASVGSGLDRSATTASVTAAVRSSQCQVNREGDRPRARTPDDERAISPAEAV